MTSPLHCGISHTVLCRFLENVVGGLYYMCNFVHIIHNEKIKINIWVVWQYPIPIHSLCVSNPEHVAIFCNAFVLPFKNCLCLTDIVWNVALIPSTLLPDDKETSQAALGKLLWERTGQYWNNVSSLYRDKSLAPQITLHSFSFAQNTSPILCICVCVCVWLRM